MSADWAAKRFWTAAEVAEADNGFGVTLDGRSVKTPAKAPLTLPSRALAQALAEEWDAQEKVIDPTSMPLTRLANSAIDKVTPQHAAVAEMLAEYGGSDLLCYRAESPEELIQRQAAAWDPWVDWAAARHEARLILAQGLMPVEQPPAALERLHRVVSAHDPFALTALHEFVTLTGSLVLGLAVSAGALEAGEAWDLSRVDERWQEEQWGHDEEAAALARAKREAILAAQHFRRLSLTGETGH